MNALTPSVDQEVCFEPDEIIVSKTDTTGRITYANGVFGRVSGFTHQELMGAPHSILRHPDMPRCIFKLLWARLGEGHEVFAYVKNRTKSGAYYWAFAHATPNFDAAGQITGYHSSRRVPERRIVREVIAPLYAELLNIEQRAADRKQGLQDSTAALLDRIQEKGVGYDEFILSL